MAFPLYPRKQVAHSALIDQLCQSDPEIKRKGFWRAAGALAEEIGFWEELRKQPFVPDAFKINRETCEIEIHEVIRTHGVTENKMIALGLFWGEFDAEQEVWLPVLFVHREDFPSQRVDLCEWYHKAIMYSASFPTGMVGV